MEVVDYMGIRIEEFITRTDQARSPHLWDKDKSDNWISIQDIEELKNNEK